VIFAIFRKVCRVFVYHFCLDFLLPLSTLNTEFTCIEHLRLDSRIAEYIIHCLCSQQVSDQLDISSMCTVYISLNVLLLIVFYVFIVFLFFSCLACLATTDTSAAVTAYFI